jgi:hypothetical protein
LSASDFVRPFTVRLVLPTTALFALVACGGESATGPDTPDPQQAVTEIQVDASAAPAYIRLGDTIRQVSVANPTTSSDWDLSVFATTVALNSGPAGPADVSGVCLCGNAGISNTAIQSLTAASELPAFLAVGPGQIPADAQFSREALVPRITGWFTGAGASAVANAARTFVVLRSRVLPIPLYGKFRVTAITGATASAPGSVTFEYAMQATSTGPLPEARSATVSVGSTPVYFDFVAGETSSAGGTWDIQFDGFLIRANSGASGGAGHLVAPPQDVPFASLDLAALRAVPNAAFGQDALGGPFGAAPWYRYNVTGTDMQIWPNFNVYLVKRGTAVYKVQLTGYYGLTGQSRVVTIRSVRLR